MTNQIVKKPRLALIVKNKLQKFRFVVFGLVFDPLSKTKKNSCGPVRGMGVNAEIIGRKFVVENYIIIHQQIEVNNQSINRMNSIYH